MDEHLEFSDNAIKLIEGDALLNMKYKTCLENLDFSYNKFNYQISVGPPIVKTCVMFERSIQDCSG
jgi:hypothetical protein